MKALFKGLGVIVALTIAGMILATVAPQIGVWVGLAFLVVPLFAVIKPLPQLHLGHRAFSASVAFFVGLLTTATSYGTLDTQRLADLRNTDPTAYLAELEGRNQVKWLSELEKLDPDRYPAEAAKIAEAEVARKAVAEAAEAARVAEQERAEVERRDAAPYWVTSERLNRRTCPSESCGIVGQFFFREGIMILERRDGWVRVTKPYSAWCVDGRSEYVDSGNANCDSANGIMDGQFAEWVSAEYLSDARPPDPTVDASGIEELVIESDDFARYRTAFAEAAQSLILQRRCTEQDFREMGGWVKSSSHRNQPIYFTYCGGATVANRLYLNADTGEVFR